MKTTLYLFFILFLGVQVSAEAQILKKFGKAVKEAAEKVLEEKLSSSEDTAAAAKKETKVKTVPSQSDKSAGIKKSGAVTMEELLELKNLYEANTQVERFGPMGEQLRISSTGDLFSTVAFEGSRQVIWVNGKAGSVYDKIMPQFEFSPYGKHYYFEFSPDGRHYYYFAEKGGKKVLVIDGKEAEVMDIQHGSLTERNIGYSLDGSKLAYFKALSDKSGVVVINGKPGPEIYSGKGFGKIFIIRNDVYYIGREVDGDVRPQGEFFYRNNLKESESLARELKVSQDGKNYLYTGYSLEGKRPSWLVFNGEKKEWQTASFFLGGDALIVGNQIIYGGKKYPFPEGQLNTEYLTASSDGKHFAIVLERKGSTGYTVWVDGKPGRVYQGKPRHLTFTGDSQKFLYAINAVGKNFVVVNNKELGPYGDVTQVEVSNSGGDYAYFTIQERKRQLYLNGEFKMELGNGLSYMDFSPDGKRYGAWVSEDPFFVMDSEKVAPEGFIRLTSLTNGDPRQPSRGEEQFFFFSPEGDRVAYCYQKKVQSKIPYTPVLVLDDEEAFLEGYAERPLFSPDGSHFVFLDTSYDSKTIRSRLYINMKPGPIVQEIEKGKRSELFLEFTDNNTLKVIGAIDGEVLVQKISL